MSDVTINLTSQLYTYYQKHALRDLPILKKCRELTSRVTGASMQISPEQGQFMGLLIELLNARKTLDIGTFTGYSALVVALALPADGKVIACDVSTDSTKIATECWAEAGVADKIDLRIAPAVQTLEALISAGESSTFDFAFIDADKANYDAYYELALRLLRRGGLIAIDNVLWSGAVADPKENDAQTKALRALNTKLLRDERVSLSMLPIGDGLTLARKR